MERRLERALKHKTIAALSRSVHLSQTKLLRECGVLTTQPESSDHQQKEIIGKLHLMKEWISWKISSGYIIAKKYLRNTPNMPLDMT